MKRAAIAILIAACLSGAVGVAHVLRSPPPLPTIAILQYTANNTDTVKAFKATLADLGWRQGQSVAYLDPGPALTIAQLRDSAAWLVGAAPTIVLASPTPAAQAAKQATRGSSIPVLFAPANDPVSAGLVASIQSPEANLTGVRLAPSEGRRLQELKELKPGIVRVLVPYNPKDSSAQATLSQISEASATLGIELLLRPIDEATAVEIGSSLDEENFDAIFLPREGLAMSRFREFNVLAEAHRVPMTTPRLDQVRQGVVTGYGFTGEDVGKQAARMAARLLKGAEPAQLPVETATDTLFVNLAAARRIGLDVPDAFLRRCAHIVREEAP